MIPYVEQEFNPNFIETMNRLSNLVVEQEEYIQKQVENIYEKIVLEEKIGRYYIENISSKQANEQIEQNEKNEQDKEYVILDLKKFNEQEKVIKSNIILYTITRLFHTTKGIEKIHIEDIIKLCTNNIGNKFLMPNKNLKVFIKNREIKISKEV